MHAQGDVEAVASQSPKDLARLIDQISGSLDLKDEYDRCASALQKATEQSVAQHSRRKGVNSEVKQYQTMKSEAERWQSLQAQRADAVIHHLVWKLFHVEEGIRASEEKIDERNEELKALREENEKFEEAVRGKKKEVNKAQKEVTKEEKALKAKEKELEEAVSPRARSSTGSPESDRPSPQRPELDGIDTKRQHALKKLKTAEDQASKQRVDLNTHDAKLEQLKRDLETTNKTAEKHRQAQKKAAREKGISLSSEDLAEYNKLCVECALVLYPHTVV